MRVLLGSDTYHPDVNGASRFTQRLARGLADRGHAVQVVSPSTGRRFERRSHEGIPIAGVRSVPVPLYPTLRFCPPHPGRFASMLGVIRTFRPDLIHVHNHFFLSRSLLRIGTRLGIPVVATNHVVPENLMVHGEFLPRPVARVVDAWLTRDLARAYEGAAQLTTPTPIAADELTRCGARARITAISNGIEIERFLPDLDPADARLALGLPERPTVGFVGRLDREKRLERLFEAFARMPTPDARLLIVGDGKERGELERLAERLDLADRVRFTGFLDDSDLPLAYAACDVFCMPGTAELQSIATLEAMATGKPIVAADALALPHLVAEGENGHLYPPEDRDALAGRLADLLADADRRTEMGRRSLELVARHAGEATIDAYESIYEGALAQAPAPSVEPAAAPQAAIRVTA